MEKINLNQKLYNEFGKDVIQNGKPAVTLRDAITNSILTFTQKDDDKKKYQKYELFKKVIKEEEFIELSSAEKVMIEESLGAVQPPLIYGQCLDMLEGKFDPKPFELLRKREEKAK